MIKNHYKLLIDGQTVNAIIKHSATISKTLIVGARIGTFDVIIFALTFTFCSNILIPENSSLKLEIQIIFHRW